MGTDTRVYFPHRIEPRDLPGIPDLLNSCRIGLEPLESLDDRDATPSDDPGVWSWAELFGPEYRAKDLASALAADGDFPWQLDLRGPSGLFVSIGRRNGFISLSRWGFFLGHALYQADAREACRVIARALGGGELLYMPDQTYQEARWGDRQDYQTIREGMAAELGPPAPSLEQVRALVDAIDNAWRTDTAINVLRYSDAAWALRYEQVEREVRSRFSHGAYFVEPVD